MPKVKSNSGLVGKSVARLDGSTDKIIEVIGRGYKTKSGGRAISPDCLVSVKGKLTEIEPVSKRMIEDSGKGYAKLTEEAPAKKSKSEKSEKDSGKSGKSGKGSGKSGKSTKDEKPAKGKSKKADADEKPAKGKAKRKQAEAELDMDDEIQQVEIDDINQDLANEINKLAKNALTVALKKHYSNITDVKVQVQFNPDSSDDNQVVNVNSSVFIAMPQMPEFEMSKAVAKVVLAGVWETQVEKESGVAKKVAALLDLDEGVYPEVGSSLVDEDGSMFFFAGIHKDKKHFVLQDEDGAAVLLVTADFEAYDMPVSSAAPDGEELELDLDDDGELELDLDDDSESDESADENEGDDPLAGMDEKAIAKLLKKKWSRSEMEQYLEDYFELDDEEIETIAELSDDELADYVANYCAAADNAAEEEEEEEEESDEDEDPIDADYINGLSSSELANLYNENKSSLPSMPKAIRNQTDKKKRKAALAAWLIENLVEEDEDSLGLDEDEFGDDE